MTDQAAQISDSWTVPTLDVELINQPPITVVVPCFNEEEGLPYLAERLQSLRESLGRSSPLSLIIVDDGSTDGTWDVMQGLFDTDQNATCLRHTTNRGIAAASVTGITASKNEIVAVIDSDCSYDPNLIAEMLPHLAPDVSLITASPYHSEGAVCGVSRWRIFLSSCASRSYRFLLRNKLATYTSCFRIYRRSAVVALPRRRDGFTGVAEKLALLDRQGWRIVEVPAVLKVRRFGQSKLKVARAIQGHLGLMVEIAVTRITKQRTPFDDRSVTRSLENGSSSKGSM